ncbi:hypothetical protein [Streptomyces sp. NPDC086023]|uniref:hypothetical protein n=1 Tax=Streptomyces sp. NPDC086023 TaxID=3365746 RepID=UPI0037D7B2FC
MANELPAEPESVPEAVPAAAVRPRRRGRTTLLIAAAAVLGALAGTVTGYAVQYDREPTPLPPLAQRLAPSKTAPGVPGRTNARTLNVHRWVKSDGDLRELLVKKPKGAKDFGAGKADWVPLVTYAADFDWPDRAFRHFANEDLRRVARVEWQERGEVFVVVELTQFNDTTQLAAADFAEQQQGYEEKDAGNDGKPLPGSGNGRVFVHDQPFRKAGYEPVYQGQAIARRGDVVMRVYYRNNTRPVSEKALMDLAKRQWERL